MVSTGKMEKSMKTEMVPLLAVAVCMTVLSAAADVAVEKTATGFSVRSGDVRRTLDFYGPNTLRVKSDLGRDHWKHPSLAIVAKARPFGLSEVRLGEGVFRERQETDRAYLLDVLTQDAVWDKVRSGNFTAGGFDVCRWWVPNYTTHKVFAGLRDAYRLAGSKKALEVERRFGDWLSPG